MGALSFLFQTSSFLKLAEKVFSTAVLEEKKPSVEVKGKVPPNGKIQPLSLLNPSLIRSSKIQIFVRLSNTVGSNDKKKLSSIEKRKNKKKFQIVPGHQKYASTACP